MVSVVVAVPRPHTICLLSSGVGRCDPVRGGPRHHPPRPRRSENVAADQVHLTDDQLAELTNLPPAAGDTHNEAQMRMMER